MDTKSFLSTLAALSFLVAAGCTGPGDNTGPFSKLPSGTAPTVQMSLGASSPVDDGVTRSEQNVSMLQFTVTAGSSEDVTLDTIVFQGSGTGDDAADISSCSVFTDEDGDGLFSPGVDILVAFGFSFAADDGTLTAPVNRPLAAGQSETYVLLYQFAGTASTGETFRASVAGTSALQATGADSGLAAQVALTPFAGRTVTIEAVGGLAISAGANMPAGGVVDATASDLAVIQVSVTADAFEAVNVTAVAFEASGTLHDVNHLSTVRLARDDDGSGTYGAGTDTTLATAPYDADDGTVAFDLSGSPHVIAAGATEDWILVYDLASPTPGTTFSASLAAALDVTATGDTSGLALTPSGTFPVDGPAFQVRSGTLTVAAGSSNPAAASVTPVATNAVLQLSLAADAVEDIQISALAFTAAGTGHDANDLGSVSLYVDNGTTPGALDGTDTFLSGGSYGSDDGSVLFSSLGQTVTAGTSQDWILVYTFSGGTAGSTYRASHDPATQVTALGALSAAAPTISGSAVTGNDFTVQYGTLAVAAGSQNPGAGSVTPPAANVAVLQVTLTTGPAEGVSITQATVHASGTGDDANDLSGVDLYVDDGTTAGAYDAGDTLLASSSYSADNGSATFTFSRTIALSTAEDWLVCYNFSAGTAGQTFVAGLTPSTDITAAGVLSGQTVTATGSAVTGSTFTIGTGSTVTWRALSPSGAVKPGGLWGHSAVFDSANNRIYMFGGNSSSSTTSGAGFKADLWAMATVTQGSESWRQITGAGTPPGARAWHASVYDPTNGYIYIVGGLDAKLAELNDVWRYNPSTGTSGTWTQLTITSTSQPNQRQLHGAAWDPNNGRIVVYGGYYSPKGHYFQDAWYLSINGTQGSWNSVTFTSGTTAAMRGMATGYDATNKRMIIVCGYNGTSYSNNTYGLNYAGSSWSGLKPTGSPTACSKLAFGQDLTNSDLYVFGGRNATACNQSTYVYSISSNTWTSIPGGNNKPSGRCGSAGAWDSNNGRFIIYGGYNPFGTSIAPLSDCHELR